MKKLGEFSLVWIVGEKDGYGKIGGVDIVPTLFGSLLIRNCGRSQPAGQIVNVVRQNVLTLTVIEIYLFGIHPTYYFYTVIK